MGKFRDIWDRDKDGGRREQRSFVRYAIVATALFVLFLFVKKDNVITWIGAGFTIGSQQRQIEKYESENAQLDDRIEMMRENRDSLEKFARENYLFSRPGDDVYLVDE